MSQKYPEGAIIVHPQGAKRKVLGCAGEIRFVSTAHDYEQYEKTWIVNQMESWGYTVEETPWVPEEGEIWFSVRETLKLDTTEWSDTDPYCLKMRELGNCYRTYEEAQAAAERVRKAYKGEK